MFLLILHYAFYFINFLQLILSVSISLAQTPTDVQFLLQFRDSLPEPSRILLPWNQTGSPSSHCRWIGVSCYSNKNSHVKGLNLTGFSLLGTLDKPISSLCQLPSLLYLDLSGNNFTGDVPGMLRNCSQLHAIFLNDNLLSGSIPPELFKSDRLLQLHLGFNQLSGAIPPEVGLCKNIEFLGLNNNLLSGEIPHDLFNLQSLMFLHLSMNNFSGTLPHFSPSCSISDFRIHVNAFSGPLPLTLGNCHHLTTFYASQNNLEGIISPEIFIGLSELQFLYLYENNLEGEIPETLWGLSNLEELVLSGNKLNGSISEKIGDCHMLTIIALSDNNLVGQIPRSIGSLKSLNSLFLFNNMLNGTIPPELGNCSSLVEIRLQKNSIGGRIPPEICKLRRLEVFYVFYNRLEGYIPWEISEISSLVEFGVYNNSLTGTIPPGITNLTNLKYFALANNNFTGEVPPEFGKNSPDLTTVDLTGNSLDGPIPLYLCSGNRLRFLTLGNNYFNGNLPTEIAECKSLERLILRDNLLQGSIPEDMGKNPSVVHFDVHGNKLEGKIPAVFGFWSNLSMIDFSENSFSGSIPPEFGKLQNLQTLNLSSNRLSDEIPAELSNCNRLFILDLSRNNISGGIPSEIMSSKALQKLFLQNNELRGIVPDVFSPNQKLQQLQLGNNMLEGGVPCSLSRLQEFSIVLNLSYNRLSGEIPKCLGSLDKLEILDLSSNNFSGELPWELNNMRSMSFVNISFNRLSGQVPTAWAKLIASHPGSALGNQQLNFQDQEGSSGGPEDRKSHRRNRTLAAVIISGVLLVFVIMPVAAIYMLRVLRHPLPLSHNYEQQSSMKHLPENLTYEDILRAMEGWHDGYMIGRGRHGTVYRIESVYSKRQWAVKKVDLSTKNFGLEVGTLKLVRHRNLVKMAGYCIKDGYGFIVTEYMPGGTLFHVLHGQQDKPGLSLNWELRHRIALGIAQGLSYLHHDCVPQIIHRDIKSDNILMDSELVPKIGDFGMAKLVCDSDESWTMSSIVGTLGYMAPENGYSTQLTEKCDVYSYGVILLELLCRRLPVDPSFEEGFDIVYWVMKKFEEADHCFGCLDDEIKIWDMEERLKALKMLDLALLCTQQLPYVRPSMREVVGYLIKLNNERI